MAQETLNTLLGYHWPGNVRELGSVIERAVITSQGTALQVLEKTGKGCNFVTVQVLHRRALGSQTV